MAEQIEPEAALPPQERRRTTTGIAGFDEVMVGGLLNGATHLIVGPSGTGKTVFTQQIAFHQARQGNNVLCLTMMAETHEKMIANLGGFAFFDETLVGHRIQYLSLLSEIEKEGLAAFSATARRSALKYQARLIIVDGIGSLRDFANSRQEFRKTLYEFNSQLSMLGCTVLMLVDDELEPQKAPEHAIADSIIRLYNQLNQKRHVRSLEVLKSRATAALTGLHPFDINEQGVVVYPRIEALLHRQKFMPPPANIGPRQAFGVAGLDAMTSGGLLRSTLNLFIGTPGTGKSTTGLRFVYEGVRQGERVVLLTLQHSEASIRASTAALGFDLGPYLDNGLLKLLWVLPLERHLDEIVGQLLKVIEVHQPSRLFIDSLTELEALNYTTDQDLTDFWVAFTNYLRNKRITMLAAMDYRQVVGGPVNVPERPISMMADTVFFTRSLEIRGELKSSITILEMKYSGYDHSVREFKVTDKGIEVGEPFTNYQRLLSGQAEQSQTQLPKQL